MSGVGRFLEGLEDAVLSRKTLPALEDTSGTQGVRRSFGMGNMRDTGVLLNPDYRHYGLVHCGLDAFVISLPSPGDPMLSASMRLAATPASAPDSDNPHLASAGVESPEDGIFAVMAALKEWGLSRALGLMETLPPSAYDPVLSPAGAAAWALVTMYAQRGEDSAQALAANQELERLALKGPQYPEFSLVLASLLLRQAKGLSTEPPTTRQRLSHARELCYQALRSGPPLYSQSVRLLTESTYLINGLGKRFGASLTEQQSAEELAWLAQGLSIRTSPYQPFTVLRMR